MQDEWMEIKESNKPIILSFIGIILVIYFLSEPIVKTDYSTCQDETGLVKIKEGKECQSFQINKDGLTLERQSTK